MKKVWLLLVSAVLGIVLLGSAAAANDLYLDIYPRESMAVGGSLDFEFDNYDTAENQYVHVLREEEDGTYTPVAVITAWDAASNTLVRKIEAGTVTEPGSYWLTLGADPDYTGLDWDKVAAVPFRTVERQLAAPAIENVVHSDTVGTDVSFRVTSPEGTGMLYTEFGWLDGDDFVVEYWDVYRSDFNVLGLYTAVPGTYQIRAVACPQGFGETASETFAESETAVFEFTLAPGDIPECPAPILDKTDADYSQSRDYTISYTVPGAEAVTSCYNVVNPFTGDNSGTGSPSEYTVGESGIIATDEADGPGEYHIYCWGRFNGVWSKQGEAVFTLTPLGYLDAPAVSWRTAPVEGTLQVSTANPLVLSVTCANAHTLSCEVMEKSISGGYEWLDWIDCETDDAGTAIFDLSDVLPGDGLYQLRFVGSGDGWISRGESIVLLTVGNAEEAEEG